MNIILVSLLDTSALGPRSIAAYLKSKGIGVKLVLFKSFEVNNVEVPGADDIDTLVRWIVDQHSEFVGISLRSPLFHLACEITEALRKAAPGIRIIWGGPHCTVEKEKCLEHADYVSIGEGEESLAEFLSEWPSGTLPQGIIDRDHPYTDLCLVKDLGTLPSPLYETDEIYHFSNSAVERSDPYFSETGWSVYEVQTNRGCPFNCSYCCSPIISDRKVRPFPVGRIMEELVSVASRHRLDSIVIIDEIFGVDISWLKEFSERYRKEIGVPYVAQLHPAIVTENRVPLYKEAGMECAILGVQSGSEWIRKNVYNREGSNAELLQKINLLLENGIGVNIDIIVDNPYEREEDLADTFNFILSIPREVGIKLFSLINLPGTELTERLIRDGIMTVDGVEHRSCKSHRMWRGRLDKAGREGWRQYWTTLILLASLRNHSDGEMWDGVTSVNSPNYHNLHMFSVEELRNIASNQEYRNNPSALHEFALKHIGEDELTYLL